MNDFKERIQLPRHISIQMLGRTDKDGEVIIVAGDKKVSPSQFRWKKRLNAQFYANKFRILCAERFSVELN